MCLHTITKKDFVKSQKVTVYKVLDVVGRKMFTPYTGFRVMPNKWHRCAGVYLNTDRTYEIYHSGFHSYKILGGAIDLIDSLADCHLNLRIYEATAKEILCEGIQDGHKVIVSRYLKINRRIK